MTKDKRMDNYFSGFCLIKILNNPPMIMEFLSHLKINNFGNHVDRHLFKTIYENFNQKDQMLSPMWQEGLKDDHIARLYQIRDIREPLDSDIEKIAKGVREDFKKAILESAALAIMTGLDEGYNSKKIIREAKGYLGRADICDEKPYRSFKDSIDGTIQGRY